MYNDPYGRFIVAEINNERNVIWLVGIYAPNHVAQCIAYWGSLLDILSVGKPRLLMGNFSICVYAS